VRELTTGATLEALRRGEIDLGILALPVPEEGLHVERLLTEPLLLCLPAAHPLVQQPRVRMKDLAAEPFVLLNEAHCLAGETRQFCARHALAPVVTAELHQLATVLELVRLGHGLSFVPEMAARSSAVPGLIHRPLSGDHPERTLAVVWSKLRFRSPLFRRFVTALVEATPG
jgi:LysR family hydrogen peroxide-inducible transcriptional activator